MGVSLSSVVPEHVFPYQYLPPQMSFTECNSGKMIASYVLYRPGTGVWKNYCTLRRTPLRFRSFKSVQSNHLKEPDQNFGSKTANLPYFGR